MFLNNTYIIFAKTTLCDTTFEKTSTKKYILQIQTLVGQKTIEMLGEKTVLEVIVSSDDTQKTY
jgi:hypothetical protein